MCFVQDYDDSYTIQHAKQHNACILTNDQYRDYVSKQPEASAFSPSFHARTGGFSPALSCFVFPCHASVLGFQSEKSAAWAWLRSHCISFTFARDELIPNPDFVFPEEEERDVLPHVTGLPMPVSASAFESALQAQHVPASAGGCLPALDGGGDWGGAMSQEEMDALLAMAVSDAPMAQVPPMGVPPRARPPPGL